MRAQRIRLTPQSAQGVLQAGWRTGAAYLAQLDDGQLAMAQAILDGPPGSAYFALWGRQSGKSFALLSLAGYVAQSRGWDVRYAALTAKATGPMIVLPGLEEIHRAAPEWARPHIDEGAGRVQFPGGGSLTWAGTDSEQFRRLRGGRTHLVILDEVGFYADLLGVEAALLPQLVTTGGRTVYATTPSESPAHPAMARYRALQAAQRSSHRTIHGNPRLSPTDVAAIAQGNAERLGLSLEAYLQSTSWRREYLAEVVTETSSQVVPEWTEALEAQLLEDAPRPAVFDAYVALDAGFRPDPSAALFSYLDPARRVLVVEEELEVHGRTLGEWAAAVKEVESRLWGVDRWDGTLRAVLDDDVATLPEWLRRTVDAGAPRQPYRRVGDYAPQAAASLAVDHGVAVFTPDRKVDTLLRHDRLREALRLGRVRIHPRCQRLRQQLYTTVWNRQRTSYERTLTDHGDLLACLAYQVEQTSWTRDSRGPLAPPPEDVSLGAYRPAQPAATRPWAQALRLHRHR